MQFIDGKTYDICDGCNTIQMIYIAERKAFYAQRGFLAGYLNIPTTFEANVIEFIKTGYITVKESE